MADKEMKLKVAEAISQSDVGRSIARIDPACMQELGLIDGDIVEIEGKKITAATAASSQSDIGLGIIRIDGYIRKNVGASIGEEITVTRADTKDAEKVVLAPVDQQIMVKGDVRAAFAGRILTKGDIIVSGFRQPATAMRGSLFDEFFRDAGMNMSPMGEIKLAVVSTKPKGVVKVTQMTDVEIQPNPVDVSKLEGVKNIVDVTYEDIGGLKDEVKKVREMIELPLRHPEIFDRLGIDPPRGVLLHGAPGTGKTLLAKAVANESGSNFVAINGPEVMSKYVGEAEKKIRDLFKEAEENAPTVIFIDEIDAIAPKREEVTGEVERRVVAQILALMDGLKERGKVIVIGATNRPDALDQALRRPGRFDREIELRVPDRDGRSEIMQIHTRGMPLEDDVDMEEIADITHGFVGADLAALSRESAMNALRRILPELDLEEQTIPQEVLEKLFVTNNDFMDALKSISPSALREVFIEVPDIRWEDIGGLQELKETLREAVEWPLTNSEDFKRIGIQPSKGILLFGPPGTGKTMLSKAVATESKANFISVKGSEILSRWFGESERKIAEIFKKGKQASPCIIFFDEIDAIAPMRGSAAGEPRVVERMVNTLLSEMDGLEELRGVVVIGATNRPDLIDAALLRPGRFDEVVLVSPPDEKARLEILKVHTKSMALDDNVNLVDLSKRTEGYSGADIEALCRKAGVIALHENIKIEKVSKRHFEAALSKVNPSTTPQTKEYYEEVARRLGRGLEAKKVREEFPREVA